MIYRTLGKTGFKVAEIGIGTWQLANDPGCWVGADPVESLKCLYRYTELGGNFIDTAWGYGYDESKPDRHPSEELIGKFLKESGKRKDLVVATKIAPKNWTWPALKNIPITEVFTKEHIEKQVNDSLRSLGVDSIDIVQFHVWQDEWSTLDEWKETVTNISKAGKVKFWGISANDYQPSNCLKTLDTGLISTIQFIFNIFHQKPTEKLLPYARENNIGLIARVALDEGGLSGKITNESVFDKDELRYTYFGDERLAELVRRTDELKKLLGAEAATLPELALRYVLSFPEVSTVIPGMRKLNHVEENVALADGKFLSADLMRELKKHTWERNFYGTLDPWLKDSNYVEA